MSSDEVFKCSVDCDMNGAKYKMPCKEDMMIHIIVHGSERNDHRPLRWVVDVVSIIRSGNIDWDFFIERIKKFEVGIEINVAFTYLINNFSISIPESFIEKLGKLPLEKDGVKDYYRRMDTIEKSILGTFPCLWNRYWLYDKKGNLFTSWYYFVDYICESWGISKKREIPLFIYEKYKKRIKLLLKK